MKVLQINFSYSRGSTGRIMQDIHGRLRERKINSIVIFGRGNKVDDPYAVRVSSKWECYVHSLLSRCFSYDFGYSPISTARAICFIKKEKPDIVHLHGLNCHFLNAYKMIRFLKKNRIHTVLTLHSEIMHTAGCEHALDCEKWKIECYDCPKIQGKISGFFRDDAKRCFLEMKKSFSNFDELVVVGVSQWLTDRAKQSGVFANNTKISFKTITNGLDTDSFRYIKPDEVYKKKKILFVTPSISHPLKGGDYLFLLADRNPDWEFMVVGDMKNREIKQDNIKAYGKIYNKEKLAEIYSIADVTILLSKRETFSMICAESLCCGTPVVGFKAGAPETISIQKYSSFVEYGDIESLEIEINRMLTKGKDPYNCQNEARRKYAKAIMADEYINLYNDMCSKGFGEK